MIFPITKSIRITTFISLAVMSLWILPQNGLALEKSTAYQLALMHTQAMNPDKVILEGNVRPKDSTVAEFQWLLDSVKNRCINSEESIVYTAVSAWKLVKSRGYPMTLLETFRALTQNAQNKSLFGPNKIDFEKTSGYWTSHFKPEK